jgi:hypothetical protein
MKNNKICLIHESKYSSYHNPGDVAVKIFTKNYKDTVVLNNIPDNLEEYLKFSSFDTVIFINAPTIRPTIYEISKIRKTINVGMYFDDTAQYFNNWFRYLTQVIDFALCWEPADVSLFETYGVPAEHFPGLFNTYLEEILNHKNVDWNNREIDCLHIGRMDRPGRDSLQIVIEKKFKKTEFWGEGTVNGYISAEQYIEKLFNSKIALNNSGCAKYNFVKKTDPIEWGRRQFKGKLFHYFLSKCLVLTEDSPFLDKYFKDKEDLLIYKNEKELISNINFAMNNEVEAIKISNSGYRKALEYINTKDNMNKLLELIKRSQIKKKYRIYSPLYIDKYFSRSIAAFNGDEIVKKKSNFLKFIKTFNFLLIDPVLIKILFRKLVKKFIKTKRAD